MSDIMKILSKCSSSTFFHTPMWLETIKQFWGLEWYYDLDNIDGVELVMPVSIFAQHGKEFHFSTFKGYGGIISSERIADRQKWKEIECRFVARHANLKTRDNPLLPWQNQISQIFSSDYGYIVDRYSRDELTKHHKRKIALAKRNSIICRLADSQELYLFYKNCYLQTVNSWKNPSIVYKYSFFEYLDQFEDVRLYVAEYNREIIAGVITLSFGCHTHIWLSGVNQDNKHLAPVYLLVNEVIEALLPSHIQYVDLGISGRNDNLLFFKRGFGGTKYESIQYETTSEFYELKRKLIDSYERS